MQQVSSESSSLARVLSLPTASRQRGQPRPPRVSWDDHTDYLSEVWEPGQHITIISPTGRGGKTFMVTRGLLPFFEDFRVIFIDVKDRDKTVYPPKGRPFFKHRVQEFPNPLQVRWASWPKHFHLHVRSGLAGGGSLGKQRRTIWQAMASAYKQQNWLIVADEIGFLTANPPDGLGLGGTFKDIWRRGRSNTTLIAMTQEPTWIPSAAYSQPQHLYLGRLGADGNKRLGEIGASIDYHHVRDILGSVKKRQFLYIDKGADEPEEAMVVTGL